MLEVPNSTLDVQDRNENIRHIEYHFYEIHLFAEEISDFLH